jgi:hypothetical protein
LESIPSEEKLIVKQSIQDCSSVAGSTWCQDSDQWDELAEDATWSHPQRNHILPTLLSPGTAYWKGWNCILGVLTRFSGASHQHSRVAAAVKHDTLLKREQMIMDFLNKYIHNCSTNCLRNVSDFAQVISMLNNDN